jgi:hypothetical protein
MNEQALITLNAILAIALFFAVLRIVRGPDRELVAERELEAKRYRALRSILSIGLGEEANLQIGGNLVYVCEGVHDPSTPLGHHVCGPKDAPFFTKEELEDVNGESARPTSGYVASPAAIDRAADWLAAPKLGRGR